MTLTQSNILIVGASISGLAVAAALTRYGLDYTIIEKQSQVAFPWRNHYDRLHLHTDKSSSNLPYKKFLHAVPRYPGRQQVVDYLEDYREAFNINPIFNTEAKLIKQENDWWITETNSAVFRSKYIIVATGAFGKPKIINFKGMETFNGNILHSAQYKTGREFTGKKVLVVGFGNSACEIAIDLYEHGAKPYMSVRSPVNVVPRDIMGIPILQLSIPLSLLPSKIADKLNAPLIRSIVGDIKKLGLEQLPYGPLEQIQQYGTVPLLDIGTIEHIRKGHIKLLKDIDHIIGDTIHFVDGKEENFHAIIAGIGYSNNCEDIIKVDHKRFEDLKVKIGKQKYFGKDRLYFCGFWVSPTGQIREISLDAKKIAKDIFKKENAV